MTDRHQRSDDITIGTEVHVAGSRPADAVWRVMSINERDGAYHVKRTDRPIYRDVLRSEMKTVHDEPFTQVLDDSEARRQIEQLTLERDRYFDSADRLRAELKAARAEIERLRTLIAKVPA